MISHISIRTKIVAGMALIMILSMVFILTYYPSKQEEQIYDAFRSRVTGMADMLALSAGIALEMEGMSAIVETFEWAKSDSLVSYIILTDEFDEKYAEYNPGKMPVNEVYETRPKSAKIKTGIMKSIVPIMKGEEAKGTLYLGYSIRQIQKQIDKNIRVALIITSSIFGLGIILAFLLSHLITIRLKRLQVSASRVSQGDYDIGFENFGSDELGSLAKAFETMINSVKTNIQLAQKSEKQIHDITASLGEAICVIDTRGKITFSNQEATNLLGWTEQEFVGLDLHACFHNHDTFHNSSNAQDCPLHFSKLKNARLQFYDHIFVSKSGLPIEVALVSNPLTLADEITGWVITFHDITERKQAEEEIKLERNLSNSVINNLPGVFYLIDADEKFLRWNKHFELISGYATDEFSKLSPLDLFQGEDKIIVARRIQKVFEDGSSEVEASLVTKDGELIPYYFTGARIEYEGKECLIGVGTDIAKRKQAEAERLLLEDKLRQSQKLEAVGTMVGGIAHEFNNVLQGIFLYGGILESQLTDDKSKQSLKAMLDGSQRAKKIVSQIMAFSRQSEENIVTHDLQTILGETIELETGVMTSQIEIVEEIADDCGQVSCDSNQMQQIIINLFNNAQHAMPDGGKITVSLKEVLASELPVKRDDEKEHPYLELNISDTGTGMDNETLEKLFDPFFTTKEVGEGTGLGLSVVHGLVEQMGGTITATSKLGEGSTFTILLPTIGD